MMEGGIITCQQRFFIIWTIYFTIRITSFKQIKYFV